MEGLNKSLSGKVALVTGGARGIGKAISEKLAKEGAHVIIHYNSSEAEANDLANKITSNGGSCEIIRFDVSKYQETEDKLEFLVKNHESIDILVNNAGVTADNLIIRQKEEDFDKVISTNLKGSFNCSRVISKAMMKKRYGTIIYISSVVGEMGNPGQAIYAASKAGLFGLTKSLAKELAPRNIRVNAIAPGLIASDMTEKLSDVQKDNILKSIPLARWGTAEEVANLVFFLASNESSYITGQTISINGGLYI